MNGSAYVHLRKGEVEKSIFPEDLKIIDVDANGTVLGLELLDFAGDSRVDESLPVPSEDLHMIKTLLGESRSRRQNGRSRRS